MKTIVDQLKTIRQGKFFLSVFLDKMITKKSLVQSNGWASGYFIPVNLVSLLYVPWKFMLILYSSYMQRLIWFRSTTGIVFSVTNLAKCFPATSWPLIFPLSCLKSEQPSNGWFKCTSSMVPKHDLLLKISLSNVFHPQENTDQFVGDDGRNLNKVLSYAPKILEKRLLY